MVSRVKKLIDNPCSEELRMLVSQMPEAVKSNFGNYSVATKVTARSAESTYFVSEKDNGHQCISNSEYRRIAKIQDEFIAENEMIRIEGSIGPDPDFQINCNLLVEKIFANIAAMQQQLYFSPSSNALQEFTIIDTPSLSINGYPNRRIITVDIEKNTTRIIGSDYFGESKKGGLRMWNHYTYLAGGLGLHAGCKVYPDMDGSEKLALIIGLSGTGKTTTTFRKQIGSLPVQDDFCALLPGGFVKATEDGCFAKTFGLSQEEEPVIYHALTQSESWLENVSISPNGGIDFFDGNRTTNGRGTFKLQKIEHRDPIALPKVDTIILLNRNFNIIPAVVKLNPEQAAAFFMLGETTGTSAGGITESGRFLRIPGTNPFFCQQDYLQGNRFYDLLKSMDQIGVYLFNTGRVGGKEDNKQSKKVKIKDSSAILEGIMLNSISWKMDDRFGYLIAKNVPGIADEELLQPERLYRNQKIEAEYDRISQKIQIDRRNYINRFDGLYSQIKEAI